MGSCSARRAPNTSAAPRACAHCGRACRRSLVALFSGVVQPGCGHYPGMGFDQYHEPPDELPAETRTFARLCASLTEEAEAIGWYEQRLAVEPNAVARDVMRNAVGEEYKHFSMDLEFLLRQKPEWREIAR